LFDLSLDLIALPQERHIDTVLKRIDCKLVHSSKAKNYLSLEQDILYFHSINFKKPLSFNPARGKTAFRLNRSEQEGLIKKALGKLSPDAIIFDATAGLLNDALIMCNLGYKIIAVEQSKILHTMLSLGLLIYPKAKNLNIICGDSKDLSLKHNFDAIFFDPMFESSGSALRDKQFRMIKEILALEPIQNNNHKTFEQLRSIPDKKLIVKRPIKAKPFSEDVNYQVKGRSIRYDVYI
jgi:16S rRNA (guanine1516-N2)-methyltransferase